MNKNDLINAIADSTELSKVKVGEVLDSFVNVVTKALKKGEEVRLIGFGTFAVSKRKATKGHNPRTGEEIKIPASKQPKFKAGKTLKEAINK
ncbi:HU family DNA-binding protein [bacterium]|nr:HU family DNA-binding protein [bacterium]MDE6224494.1 HU family DNA-binding protein [Alphaproteobacteria bacterium]